MGTKNPRKRARRDFIWTYGRTMWAEAPCTLPQRTRARTLSGVFMYAARRKRASAGGWPEVCTSYRARSTFGLHTEAVYKPRLDGVTTAEPGLTGNLPREYVQNTPVSHIFSHFRSINVRNPSDSHIFFDRQPRYRVRRTIRRTYRREYQPSQPKSGKGGTPLQNQQFVVYLPPDNLHSL